MKRVFASIGTSILGLLGLHLSYLVAMIIFLFLEKIIASIPVLNLVLKLLNALRWGETPYVILSLIIAYFVTHFIVSLLNKNTSTMKLTFYIIGITLIVIHIISLIINLCYNDAIYTNIMFMLLAIGLISAGRKAYD